MTVNAQRLVWIGGIFAAVGERRIVVDLPENPTVVGVQKHQVVLAVRIVTFVESTMILHAHQDAPLFVRVERGDPA
jgi:hypothetical protein